MKAHAQALKKRIVNKGGEILSAPARAYHASNMRAADRKYGVIMDRRAMTKNGVTGPQRDKVEAAYQAIKKR
jgi:hypothetical protein